VIPVYPEAARRKKVQGQVILQATVTKEGTVTDIHALRSPDPRLTNAAIDAVRHWRYRPGL
jgi:protein TonB